MGGTPKGTVRHARVGGTVEQPDEMIYLVRGDTGEILDAGIDEFVMLERMNGKYLKLTMLGKDETKPVILVIRSESRVIVREFGAKDHLEGED